jgi:hypothetical protein
MSCGFAMCILVSMMIGAAPGHSEQRRGHTPPNPGRTAGKSTPGTKLPYLAAPGKQLPSSYLPKELKFSIGSFFSTYDSFELQEKSLTYRESELGEGFYHGPIRKSVTPSADQWEQFWRELDEIGFWRWKDKYDDDSVTDATGWTLDIEFAGRRKRASGYNEFPPGFDKFRAAVQRLLGGGPLR